MSHLNELELTLTPIEFYNFGSLLTDIENYICNGNHTRIPKVTGKSLGHEIDWTVTQLESGNVVFKFNNKDDKLLFILKCL